MDETGRKDTASDDPNPGGQYMTDKGEDPRITRARLSGHEQVTKDATVAEMAVDGTITVLVKGTNEWVCTPGNENKIGDPPMCMNPMGMRWMMDAMQGKPKPTNTAPGMIYMLCGATQRSNTDPADKTSPAIPIGPHWMITWPFDAAANGLPTTVRDKGAWVMFAGTPYAICTSAEARGKAMNIMRAIRQSGPCLMLVTDLLHEPSTNKARDTLGRSPAVSLHVSQKEI
jgi:hypothetical protein